MGFEKEMTDDICGKCGGSNCTRMAMLLKRDGMHERWTCSDCKHITLYRVADVVFTNSTDESDI